MALPLKPPSTEHVGGTKTLVPFATTLSIYGINPGHASFSLLREPSRKAVKPWWVPDKACWTWMF